MSDLVHRSSHALPAALRRLALAFAVGALLAGPVAAQADIHAAIRAGDPAALQAALQDRTALDRTDSWGRTPLIVALQQGNAPMVDTLLAAGASVTATDAWGRTPLLVATQLKNTAAVRALVDKGANVNAANKNDITPLIAAAQTGNRDAAAMLMAAGAALDRSDNLGWTALMWAVYRNDVPFARLLLDKGADARHIGRDKATALSVATSRNADAALVDLLKAKTQAASADARAAAAQDAAATPAYVAPPAPFAPKIDPARTMRGKPGAPVTIVEYTDFQCPYCRQGALVLEEVMARYEGQVRLFVKQLPLPHLHPMATACAQYFEALSLQSDARAWAFYEKIFADQRALAGGEAYVQRVAAETGADLARLQADLQGALVKERLAADLAESQRYRFDGVPAFVVNGRIIEGAQPVATFFAVIDAELNR